MVVHDIRGVNVYFGRRYLCVLDKDDVIVWLGILMWTILLVLFFFYGDYVVNFLFSILEWSLAIFLLIIHLCIVLVTILRGPAFILLIFYSIKNSLIKK